MRPKRTRPGARGRDAPAGTGRMLTVGLAPADGVRSCKLGHARAGGCQFRNRRLSALYRALHGSVLPVLAPRPGERTLGYVGILPRISPRLSASPGRDCTPATTEKPMCRNIRTLFNFEPPATEDEIHASALQFVRKLSGFTHPSKANEPAFQRAIDEVADAARRLIDSLQTSAPARDREVEAAKARARARERYGTA